MAVIVQKYGGTSVGSLSRIEAVAENIIATVRQGHQVVVVLSAMSGETNRLLGLAQQLDSEPATRELDMLLSSGEQVSISLLSIALIQRGISAISLLAHQIGIKTNNRFGNARIEHIETERLHQALAQEQVIVVAGFQGQDRDNNITTLGRGGSDTSAVALAVALGASECQIFTDVDGVYTADPRLVNNVTKIPAISFDEMLVMASLGAKVLQDRAVEYAFRHEMPIRVLSSLVKGTGTQVMTKQTLLAEHQRNKPVTAVCHQQQEALVTIDDIDHQTIAQVFKTLEEEGVTTNLTTLCDNQEKLNRLAFTIPRNTLSCTKSALERITKCNKFGTIHVLDSVATISVVGVGIKSHANVIGDTLSVLASDHIEIKLISTSEISLSVVIDESKLIQAVRMLHSEFGLDLSAK
ncbi:aspartate kinase [Thalassotalea euphylliae]|uniref:aspartate kinase n=1 Tax=Thalassotalea euphylliae TaxID=1655234 RepID=UPI003631AEBC